MLWTAVLAISRASSSLRVRIEPALSVTGYPVINFLYKANRDLRCCVEYGTSAKKMVIPNIKGFLLNRQNQKIRDLDLEIEKLLDSVPRIREKIGNTFEEAANLTDQRLVDLKTFDDTLKEAQQDAENLGRRLKETTFSGFGPPTKQSLSSKLNDVVEQIRCARMAAVYPEYYRDIKLNEKLNSSPVTAQPKSLEEAGNYIQFSQTVLFNLQEQYKTLNDFDKSRPEEVTRTEGDRYFADLTGKIRESIGSVKGHINGLEKIESQLQGSDRMRRLLRELDHVLPPKASEGPRISL
jgi:hypothetical protein